MLRLGRSFTEFSPYIREFPSARCLHVFGELHCGVASRTRASSELFAQHIQLAPNAEVDRIQLILCSANRIAILKEMPEPGSRLFASSSAWALTF
jgi:hypothetical protein